MPNGAYTNGTSSLTKIGSFMIAGIAALWAVISTVISVHAQQPHKGSVRLEEWQVMREMNTSEHSAIRHEVEIVSGQLSSAAQQVSQLAGKIEQLRAQVAALEARPTEKSR